MIPMPFNRERSLQELLFHWPTVAYRANVNWTKAFVASFAKATSRRSWRPTAKQLGVIQRIVGDLYRPRAKNEDAQVLE